LQIRQFHPLANLFPLTEDDELSTLAEDIRANGLREPVVLFEGQILDGRNRYCACEAAGVACRFEQYTGDDPIGYVISLNLRRRHLDASQRAMVAAKLATMKQGARTDLASIEAMSQPRAAELLNVGRASVQRAREVLDHGVPELRQALERGEVSVSAAAVVATESAEAQREIVARGEREILHAAKTIRARQAEERLAARMAHHAKLAMSVPMPERKYPVVLCDAPWRFEVYGAASGMERAADNHYPTLSIQQIAALDIPAAESAVLFLWATVPMLPQALKVMMRWGFSYRSQLVWVKDRAGTGFWVRNRHEILLIGARGDIPAPQPSTRSESIIVAPVREHSRKPDEAYEIIEAMFPTLPKIELFARAKREGWDAWGNEVPMEQNPPPPDDLAIPPFLRRSAP
jgi:N6-adenosine-specific RNA methylase IME4/ParB-like chromosome segregation protein Spo0J